MNLIYFIESFLEIIFPSRCVLCGKYSEGYICKNCFKSLKFPQNYCLTCGRPLTVDSQICYNCSREKLYWDGYEFVAYYQTMWKEILRLYKFENKPFLAKFFSEFGKEKILNRNWQIDFITYVPLSYSNFKKRGYNQSEYIAYFLSRYMRVPYGALLFLRREIRPQKTLDRSEREKNVLGAFGCINKGLNKNIRNILIVDDVYTTGATLRECSKVLRTELDLDKIYIFTAVRSLS